MTIDEIISSNELTLTPADVAGVLGVDPQAIRCEASREIPRLGFPVMRVGNVTKIPRVPFLRFLGLEGAK